jgi:hypothetical protein
MSDAFGSFSDSPISPSRRGVAVTPDDANDLAFMTKELQATGAGNISVVMAAGGAAITIPFAAGEVRAIRVSRVRATGTTATGILAFG